MCVCMCMCMCVCVCARMCMRMRVKCMFHVHACISVPCHVRLPLVVALQAAEALRCGSHDEHAPRKVLELLTIPHLACTSLGSGRLGLRRLAACRVRLCLARLRWIGFTHRRLGRLGRW